MKNKLFSIITPVYNSANIMDRFFASLEAQAEKDFELILVDDCSTDNSFELLSDYQSKSSLDIRIVKMPKNSGPGAARNKGIDLSRGEWITFIDNDDWVSDGLLITVRKIIDNNPVDCLVYDYYISSGDRETASTSLYFGEEGIISIADAIVSVRNHTFGKFYKTVCINNAKIRFPHLRTAEDMAFVPQALAACNGIYYLSKPMYYYLQRSNSISNKSKFGVSNTNAAYDIIVSALGSRFNEEIKEKSIIDRLYAGTKTLCNEKYSNREIRAYINLYEEYNPNWWNARIVRKVGKAKLLFLWFVKCRMIFALKALSAFHKFLINNSL